MGMKFFNYAEMVGQAEKVRGAQLANQLNAYKLDEIENQMEKRAKWEQIMQQVEDTPARIEALEDAGLVEEAYELAESHYSIRKAQLGVWEQEAAALNADTWKDFRYAKIQEGAAPYYLPEEYDPNWMRKEKGKITNDLKTLSVKYGVKATEANPGGQMAQDYIVEKRGDQMEMRPAGEPYVPTTSRKPAKSEGQKRLSGDSGRIQSVIRARYGSIIDEITGRYSAVEQETEGKILAAQSLAERIQRDEGLGPLEAARRALILMGETSAEYEVDPLRMNQRQQ